jgi:hypothetical protein
MAETADRHALYEASVQDAEAEVAFADETYRALRGERPLVLREDFCGTAKVACEWAASHREREAFGVDLDSEVLAWGREHNLAPLEAETARRVSLIEGDVLETSTPPADVLLALNFSYWTFRERSALRDYYSAALSNLADGGVMIMDCYGGSDAIQTMREPRECDGFTYVWDQADYDPVSGAYECHIDFILSDRSRLRRAFSYHWRLWNIPEIRELLDEAGFARSTVYWQGADEDGDGDGVFTPCERGDADPAWIAYIVAEK